MPPAIRVRGLAELQRAFKRVDVDMRVGLKGLLLAAAEPARVRAEQLATSNITNLHAGDKWGRMRTGVTTRVVYIAPKTRGARGFGPQKRPSFGPMLLEEAMEPALDQTRPEVYALVEIALDRLLERDFG
jgi:hypothetical protein